MSDSFKNEIIDTISKILEIDSSEITESSSLIDDLGAESLDLVDLSFSLGKKLGIKLPTKTVLIVAQELQSSSDLFEVRGKLNELGLELLLNGPNKYSHEQIKLGMNVSEVLSYTTISNWVELCQFVKQHPSQDGDLAVLDYVKNFYKNHGLVLETRLETSQ